MMWIEMLSPSPTLGRPRSDESIHEISTILATSFLNAVPIHAIPLTD